MTPQADFQAALLQALSAAAEPTLAARLNEEEPLTDWLGAAPANAAQLAFEALRRSFALRRQLLASTIGSAEVWGCPGSMDRSPSRLLNRE